jgi:Fic family protein
MQGADACDAALSAEDYMTLTAASRATATRDLHDLVAKGALTRSGELRHTRYRLNIPAHRD